MARALSAGIVGRGVQAILVFADIHLQVAVGTKQPPTRSDLALRERLYAVSSTAHFVAGNKRLNNISGNRAAFHKGLARLCRTKIRVVVIEGGYIQRQRLCGLNAVTHLIGNKVFRLELSAAKDRRYDWERRGIWRIDGPWRNYGLVETEALFGQGRRSNGA